MSNLRLLLVVALLASASVIQPLRGNTISTFAFSGMTFDGGKVSGTLAVDVTQGLFESANITLLSGGIETVFSGDPVAQAYDSIDSHLWVVEYGIGGLQPSFPDNPVSLEFSIPFASAVGYPGGSVEAVIGTLVAPLSIIDEDFSTATLTLQSSTPEPRTASLVFIGFAALAAASRRRLAAKRECRGFFPRSFIGSVADRNGGIEQRCRP